MLLFPMSLLVPITAAGAPLAPLAVGDAFPPLRGEYLTGRKAVLPDDARGKVALVLFGFTYQSRFAVEAWADRVRPAFAERSDATFFEVPVLGGMARLGKWFIDSGMRRGTPKTLHENVITIWSDGDRWKALVAFSNLHEDDAHVVLIGKNGRVLWLHRGPYSSEVFDAMVAASTEAKVDSAAANRR